MFAAKNRRFVPGSCAESTCSAGEWGSPKEGYFAGS